MLQWTRPNAGERSKLGEAWKATRSYSFRKHIPRDGVKRILLVLFMGKTHTKKLIALNYHWYCKNSLIIVYWTF